MTFELLVAAVNKEPQELARVMRIHSDALIVIQNPDAGCGHPDVDNAGHDAGPVGTISAPFRPSPGPGAETVPPPADCEISDTAGDTGNCVPGTLGAVREHLTSSSEASDESSATPARSLGESKTVSQLEPSDRVKGDTLSVAGPASVNRTETDSAAGPASVCLETTDPQTRVRVLRQSGKGVGRSRNAALANAQADICLFGDEDIVYDDGYEEKVLRAFIRHPEASVITFNVRVDERRRTYWNEKPHRIRWYNYGRYPAYAIAVRRRDIQKNNICYSKLFGGGARYSNGEDSLFLHDCLKAGLVLFAETSVLGEETYRESTWFKGYTDKFFYDRGVLYHFLYGKAAAVFGLRFLLSNRKTMLKEHSLSQAYDLLRKGIGKGRTL